MKDTVKQKKNLKKRVAPLEILMGLPQWKNVNKLCYEERSCMNKKCNVDYNKLFVGARLFMDSSALTSFGCKFEEIEITHLYGGVIFYKWLEGEFKGKEDYISSQCLAMYTHIYPKIVMKPSCIEMTCDCERTKFINW